MLGKALVIVKLEFDVSGVCSYQDLRIYLLFCVMDESTWFKKNNKMDEFATLLLNTMFNISKNYDVRVLWKC